MNEFDAFNVYLAFKLHFTTDRYDITRLEVQSKQRMRPSIKEATNSTLLNWQRSLVKMSYLSF